MNYHPRPSRAMTVTAGLLCLALGIAGTVLGALSLWEYSLPMALGQYDRAAQRMLLGSRADALFNGACQSVDSHYWTDASRLCNSAMLDLCEESGAPSDAAFAAEIQFQAGFSLSEQKKYEEAIQAFDSCLTHMPPDDEISPRQREIVIAARATREWLRQTQKASGQQAQDNKGDTPKGTRRDDRRL